jgi:hypothetical protein
MRSDGTAFIFGCFQRYPLKRYLLKQLWRHTSLLWKTDQLPYSGIRRHKKTTPGWRHYMIHIRWLFLNHLWTIYERDPYTFCKLFGHVAHKLQHFQNWHNREKSHKCTTNLREIYSRWTDIGITAIRWQATNLWRLPERSIRKNIPKRCQEKLLVFSKNWTFA